MSLHHYALIFSIVLLLLLLPGLVKVVIELDGRVAQIEKEDCIQCRV